MKMFLIIVRCFWMNKEAIFSPSPPVLIKRDHKCAKMNYEINENTFSFISALLVRRGSISV